MPGIALTDHGVMFGAVEFHDSAKKHGLTPIIGCEAYIAPRGRFDRTVRDEAHITLLAADEEGYKNLTALISKGFLEGYYYKPRIDMGLLEKHNKGLIVLSGCMSSLVASPLLKNDRASSVKAAREFSDIFGDRFYIEIMRHGMPEEDIINTGLISIARELNLPIVATNDSHYLNRGDAQAHDVLLCIGTGKTVADTSRMKFFSDEFYVKSPFEMRELFADIPEACDNTLEIVKRIDLKIPEKIFYLPDYPVPKTAASDVAGILAGKSASDGLDADADRVVEIGADEYLRLVCERGLIERYGEERAKTDPVLRERVEYELDVIVKMGFSSYFLIVWDFIKFARDRDIPVGPGRGSAVGSIVSYCLRITDLDPIKFKLIFERFLNPERISMPDVDTDFCVERRDEVIVYVTEKYGRDRVAQIVTFGTMAARAAVRDAGRALAVPLPDVDRIAKLIPSGPGGLSITAALEQIPELAMLYNGSPQMRKLLDTANSIEGLARHASTHAAGVVISKNPLTDHVPLVKLGDNDVNTQYDMNMVERIGLLKFDFLGLRNLTVMKAASDEIKRTTKADFDLATIPDDDQRTYDMLGRGETLGVFQLESDGMKRVCVELKPSSLDDIIALVALYRPGPMDWIPDFIASKHGRKTPKYLHPKLVPILSDTYGIACYQEQVMQIARDLANFSMGQADELRKVMGKKQKDKIPYYRQKFIDGCAGNDIDAKLAEEIFAFIEPFAGYGFNKSHAAAYGWISYQTAYLKANYPLQYFAALMSSVRDKTDKLVEYIEEAKKMGIAGTAAGRQRIDGRVRRRRSADSFRSWRRSRAWAKAPLKPFCAHAKSRRQVRRSVRLYQTRRSEVGQPQGRRSADQVRRIRYAAGQPRAIARRARRCARRGRAGIARPRARAELALRHARRSSARIHAVAAFAAGAPSTMVALTWEKETLGIFVSGHPLSGRCRSARRAPVRCRSKICAGSKTIRRHAIAGLVTAVRRTLTKAQQQMLFATVEDMTGSIECIVFPKSYGQLQAAFIEDAIVVINGRLRLRERRGAVPGEETPVEFSISVNDVQPFARQAAPPDFPGWHVTVSTRSHVDALAQLLEESPGTIPLVFHISGQTKRSSRGIANAPYVKNELERIVGPGNVRIGWPG